MSCSSEFKIDVDAVFPRLPHAPIVEAVIQWQALPSNVLEREDLKKKLESRFAEYSLSAQHDIEAVVSGSSNGMEMRQRTQWGGFRLTSSDGKYICRFNPNAVSLSRLAPYKSWSPFVAEALRFWDAFVDLAAPVAVQRIGVRFISQMPLKNGQQASDVVDEPPAPLQSIGLLPETFLRQDSLRTPDYPYGVYLRRAIQPAGASMVTGTSLIVDIDVFTTEEVKVDRATIEQRLQEMRYIKNKVFFTFVKDAENRFGEQKK